MIGKDRRRIDAPRIVAGESLFASDVQRPGMKIASVVRCPVVGGKPKSWDDAKAKAVPGVRMIALVSAGLAVIADDTYAMLTAREALEPTIVWDEGANAAIGSARMLATLGSAFELRARPCAEAATSRRRSRRPLERSKPNTSIPTRPTRRWKR